MGRLTLEGTSTKPENIINMLGTFDSRTVQEYIKAKAGLSVLCCCSSCDFRQWQALTQFVDTSKSAAYLYTETSSKPYFNGIILVQYDTKRDVM